MTVVKVTYRPIITDYKGNEASFSLPVGVSTGTTTLADDFSSPFSATDIISRCSATNGVLAQCLYANAFDYDLIVDIEDETFVPSGNAAGQLIAGQTELAARFKILTTHPVTGLKRYGRYSFPGWSPFFTAKGDQIDRGVTKVDNFEKNLVKTDAFTFCTADGLNFTKVVHASVHHGRSHLKKKDV